MSIELSVITPGNDAVWTEAVPFLQSALEVGGGLRDWDITDIYKMFQDNEIDVWVLRDEFSVFGAAVSCLKQFSRRRVVEILLLGTLPHREDDWVVCLEQFTNLARTAGAVAITGTGRPGWARKLGARELRVFEVPL